MTIRVSSLPPTVAYRLAVIRTEGNINNQAQEIARVAYLLVDEQLKILLLNLSGTKIVNSIGISILIEIIEKMIEIDGKLAFRCLTPTIEKTFHIMGLAQYAVDLPRRGGRGPSARPRPPRCSPCRPPLQRSRSAPRPGLSSSPGSRRGPPARPSLERLTGALAG